MSETKEEKSVSFAGALGTVLFLIIAMAVQVFVIKSSYTTHITLILVIAVAAIVALMNKFTWDEIQEGILYGCNLAMLPMLILMLVGMLIATWIASGTIPTLIYYGIKLLTPKYFLFSACLICCFGSVATGSSWTTAATFGVAFMGIGMGLGISPPMTAGAVISGSIFGDKMSPLSDSTNLAAGVAEADLFDHIKSMAYSTGPAIFLTLVIYFMLGLTAENSASVDSEAINAILNGLKDNYNLSPITLLPPALVVFLAIRKVGGLAVMVIASIFAAIIALILQGYSIADMLGFMNYGFTSEVGIEEVDKLLSRGGLQKMMWTVSLGFIALAMGGLLEKCKMLEVLLLKIQNLVKSISGLATTHVIASILANLVTASQYMAIIIPGRMLVPIYKEKKLLPQVCSRVCEDSATVTSPLVPWGLGGVYYTSALGVTTYAYAPFVFFALLAPAMTLLLAYTNKFMFKEGDIESVKVYN
jgi:NhaC family Na+:H+ antiporter